MKNIINTFGRTLLIILLLICYIPFIIIYTIADKFIKSKQDVS